MSYLIYCLNLKDVLRTQAMQKNLDSEFRLDNLVSIMFMNWLYSQFVSYCRRLHRILTVVKFYNHTFWLRYGCRPMWYLSSRGASLTKTVINIKSSLTNGVSYIPISLWILSLTLCQ